MVNQLPLKHVPFCQWIMENTLPKEIIIPYFDLSILGKDG